MKERDTVPTRVPDARGGRGDLPAKENPERGGRRCPSSLPPPDPCIQEGEGAGAMNVGWSGRKKQEGDGRLSVSDDGPDGNSTTLIPHYFIGPFRSRQPSWWEQH